MMPNQLYALKVSLGGGTIVIPSICVCVCAEHVYMHVYHMCVCMYII